jgi:hypothetical protein
LFLSSRRHTDTGILSLAPLKRLTLSVWVVPSEPHPQPPYAELLLVQVEEGLAMATAVDESTAPPTPAAVTVVEEERAVTKTTAPQAALEPPTRAGSGGEDVVMVLVDDGTAPPPPARERRNVGGAGVFSGRDRNVDRGRGGHVHVSVPRHPW